MPLSPKCIEHIKRHLPERRDRVICLGAPTGLNIKELGFRHVVIVDVNDYEGCDRILDLNEAQSWSEEADLVIDPGTLEHCFNIAEAIKNVARVLRPGGIAWHNSPLNWVDHGFYNLSPTFFHEFYMNNGFSQVQFWLRTPDKEPVKIGHPSKIALDKNHWLLLTVAKKCTTVSYHNPFQRLCEKIWRLHATAK